MRVVHTCLRYPPATGGAETYAHEIVQRTRDGKAGRDVRVLTSKMRTHGPISELDPELLRDDPPYVQRLHHIATPIISYPRLQALQYYIGHHKPDIIHGYGFWYHPADGAARYARKHGIPFIFHPIFYENAVRQKFFWQLYKKTIGQRTFAAADAVVVISPFEQSLIEQAGFPVRRFELIPPGIDIQEFETPRQNPYLKRNISGPVLLAVSRIAPGKGLDELIAALPEIVEQEPEAQLVLIGEDFGLQNILQQQAEQLGLTGRVHFLGKLSREHVVAAFQHAAVFVHPTHFEAFGIVIAESQAAGTPVVARNSTAVPYVTAPANHPGLFTTKNELIRNIAHIFKLDEVQRNKRVQSARQYVNDQFSWDTSIKKVTSLYTDLIT